MSENDKKFYFFHNTVFFFEKFFYRYGECTFDRPAKLFCSITRNDPKKVNERCNFSWKRISSKCSHGEGESSLKAPLTFFRQLAEIFLLDFQTKVTNWNFCREKNFSPESFFWKWECSFDKDAEIFLTKPRETFGQCPKKIRRIA